MTRQPFAIPALATALVLGCGGDPSARVGLGISASTGAATLPADIDGATTTSLHYHEAGGPVSQALLALLGAFAYAPRTDSSSTVTKSTRCTSGTCWETTTVETTTWVTDTPEEIARKGAAFQNLMDSLEATASPFQFDLEIPLRALGGDTTGFMSAFRLQSRPQTLGPFPLVDFSVGIGIGKLNYKDRTRTRLVGDDDGFADAVSMEESVGYSYIGFPVRMEAALGRFGLSGHIQADLNLLTVTDAAFGDEGDRINPSPLHFGLGFRRGLFKVIGDVALGRFRKDGVSATVEVGIGL